MRVLERQSVAHASGGVIPEWAIAAGPDVSYPLNGEAPSSGIPVDLAKVPEALSCGHGTSRVWFEH